ncbi:MAG TPA: hypothetical protein VIF15_06375 [Polyangiaceae bacterium]|jgi:hypothetical protein
MGSGTDDIPPSGPRADEADEEMKSRTGRFHVQHRGGARVEVGEPINVGGERPWMCAVKLVGRKREPSDDAEPTQTLLIRTGRGATPEDARRDALAQLTLVYGSPVEPAPSPVISQKPSDPPPPPDPATTSPTVPARPRGWLSRLVSRLRGE